MMRNHPAPNTELDSWLEQQDTMLKGKHGSAKKEDPRVDTVDIEST